MAGLKMLRKAEWIKKFTRPALRQERVNTRNVLAKANDVARHHHFNPSIINSSPHPINTHNIPSTPQSWTPHESVLSQMAQLARPSVPNPRPVDPTRSASKR
jgi:hypothetical protein